MDRNRVLVWFLLCAAFWFVGCGAAEENLGNLGVAGASCQSSPECSPPLQCMGGICAEVLSADVLSSEFADSRASSDAVSDETADADISQTDALEEPLDLSPGGLELDVEKTNIFSDCEEMGIEDHWSGTFEGVINFEIDPPIAGLLEEGALIVSGDLSFEIKCLDQKLVVAGEMNGLGEAEGEVGKHPYTSKLAGYYDPVEGRIEADLVEGVVTVLYSVLSVEVYYAGTLEGVLSSSGNFEGTWTGSETGNELGAGVVAEGDGTWQADPK